MDFNVKTTKDLSSIRSDCFVIPLCEGKTLKGCATQLDKTLQTLIKNLQKNGDFTGKCASTLLLHLPPESQVKRALLIGIGKTEKSGLSVSDYRKIVQNLLIALQKTPAKEAVLLFEDIQVTDRDSYWQYQQLAMLAIDQSYKYTKTKTEQKEKTQRLAKLSMIRTGSQQSAPLKKALSIGSAIGLGMNTAKQLGNLPGNICTPSYLASQARALAKQHPSLHTKVLEEKQMKDLGMGALLSVTAGTEQPAKLIIMEYKGGGKSDNPYVLVGKGITFDSGGISLKPGPKMDEMKYDMCGAASVMGCMTTITELKPKINVTAIIASAENLPSGKATKPGDIVTSMAGKTIEVLNTDAEGRLVLCDALSYAERYKPKAVIDIATLTGACVVALGKHATAVYSNRDDLAAQLLNAGETSYDRAWHMPLWEEYQKQLDSNFADIANVGGPEGGSITAACFLSRFADSYPWAHLDIAGTAWLSGAQKGATGRPVALLAHYLLERAKSS